MINLFNKKILIYLIFFAFMCPSCHERLPKDTYVERGDGNLTIQGEVTNPLIREIFLEKIVDNEVIPIDTFIVGNGNKFEFKVKVSEPDYYRINFDGMLHKTLILNKNDLHIKIRSSKGGDLIEISGSLEMDQIARIERIVESVSQEVVKVKAESDRATGIGDQESVKDLSQKVEKLQRKQEKMIKKLIQDMMPSLAFLNAFSFLPDHNVSFIETMFGKVEALYPNSKHIKEYREKLNQVWRVRIGQPAPDIALPDPQGDTITLASLRGKAVLIDIWAGWCRPCREENPKILGIYNQFKNKGFEIFAVSLDHSHDVWIRAIEEDGLSWIHVSDLQYFNSVVVPLYNVESIPYNILVDREGIIIAKNLKGKSLEDKLEEVLE